MPIPYAFLPLTLLRKLSRIFLAPARSISKNIKDFDIFLEQSEIKLKPEEYISMSIATTIFLFFMLSIIVSILLVKFNIDILAGLVAVFFVSLFIFSQQMMYPRLKAKKRVRDIEKNLLPALQNILVQLNSGVPLFNVLAIISESSYGGVSEQFRIAVRKINAGSQQINVLEEIAKNNPSIHFRRTLWQITNGMKTGSNMADVIKVSITNLSEEQLIQIQKYGSQLNPLAMFYMIIAVIIPALGVTLVMVLSSFLSLNPLTTKFIFWGLFGFVFFFQLMFIGMLKMRRPNLLE